MSAALCSAVNRMNERTTKRLPLPFVPRVNDTQNNNRNPPGRGLMTQNNYRNPPADGYGLLHKLRMTTLQHTGYVFLRTQLLIPLPAFHGHAGNISVNYLRIRLRRIIDNYLTARDWQRDACLVHSALLPEVDY